MPFTFEIPINEHTFVFLNPSLRCRLKGLVFKNHAHNCKCGDRVSSCQRSRLKGHSRRLNTYSDRTGAGDSEYATLNRYQNKEIGQKLVAVEGWIQHRIFISSNHKYTSGIWGYHRNATRPRSFVLEPMENWTLCKLKDFYGNLNQSASECLCQCMMPSSMTSNGLSALNRGRHRDTNDMESGKEWIWKG